MSEVYAVQSPTLKKHLLAELTEEQADAALRILHPQLSSWAEYENAITWHTECLSCANMLSSCIKETVRAETAEKELADYEENVVGEMNERAIDAARKIAELEAQLAEHRQAADVTRQLDEEADQRLEEVVALLQHYRKAYEDTDKQRIHALEERDVWHARALSRRDALHRMRAKLRLKSGLTDETVAHLLHDAARRMEDAGHDDDAVNFLDLLADRHIDGFFTDMPEDNA